MLINFPVLGYFLDVDFSPFHKICQWILKIIVVTVSFWTPEKVFCYFNTLSFLFFTWLWLIWLQSLAENWQTCCKKKWSRELNLFTFVSAFLWQLMRYNMLQLLKNLRFHSQGKEMTDADILKWANNKVKRTGRTSQMESFKVKKSHTFLQWIMLS